MYREKLMKALLQVEQMYSFVDGMKKELYRNQEALRSMMIAFIMLLAYNAEYSQLVVLAIFSQNFYNALILVSDNYLEHNEDIHVVDVVGQGIVNDATQAVVPPNSPEIVGVTDGVFAGTDTYESVEELSATPFSSR